MNENDKNINFYRDPFYVVKNDQVDITAICVYLPHTWYKIAKKALQDGDKEAIKSMEKKYGKSWKDKFMMKKSKDPIKESWKLPYLDKAIEPEWAEGCEYFESDDITYVVSMVILVTDNMNIIRQKILGTMGYCVFQQSISYENSYKKIVSDILVETRTGKNINVDPFNEDEEFWSSYDKIQEDIRMTPEFGWVYMIPLNEYYYKLSDKNNNILFEIDIKPLYPQLDIMIFNTVLDSDFTHIQTNVQYPFKPHEMFKILTARSELIEQEILKEDDDFEKKINITETTNEITYKLKDTVDKNKIDILSIYNKLSNEVIYCEANLVQDTETKLHHGTPMKKSRGLRDSVEPPYSSNMSWVLLGHEENEIKTIGYLAKDGVSEHIFKIKSTKHSFDNAMQKCREGAERFIPREMLNPTDLNRESVQSVNIKFGWTRKNPTNAKIFSKCQDIILGLQKNHILEYISSTPNDLVISIPYIIMSVKDRKDANSFAKWNSTTGGYNPVTITISNDYTKLGFMCTKIIPKYIPLVRKFILYLCRLIAESEEIDKLDQEIDTETEIIIGSSNSKTLKSLDAGRFDFKMVDWPLMNFIGRGLTIQEIKYAQRCQERHQVVAYAYSVYSRMSEAKKKSIVRMKKIPEEKINVEKEAEKEGKPSDYLYLKCPKSASEMTFMTVHPSLYIDLTGTAYKICVSCCRYRPPRSAERSKISELCIKYGFIRDDLDITPKGAKKLIQPTMTKYGRRFMKLNTPLLILTKGDMSYIQYGPERTYTEFSSLVGAITSVLHISLGDFRERIITRFENKQEDVVKFLQNNYIHAPAHTKINIEFLIKSAANIMHFEKIMFDVVEMIWESKIVVIEDGRTYHNISELYMQKGDKIFIFLKRSGIYFVLLKSTNIPKLTPENANFGFKYDDKILVNLIEELKKIHKNKNDMIENLLFSIKKIAKIDFAYSREDKSVYGLHITYPTKGVKKTSFYFPLPENTLNPYIIGSEPKNVSITPLSHCTLDVARSFLKDIGIKISKYGVNDGKIFSIQIFDNKHFFISDKNINSIDFIKAKGERNTVVLSVFPIDRRLVIQFLNKTTATSVIDTESENEAKIEVCMQNAFSYYCLMAHMILIINSTATKRSKFHITNDIIFYKLMANSVIVDKVDYIRHETDYDENSKDYLISRINNINEPEENTTGRIFNDLKEMKREDLSKLIKKEVDSNTYIVEDHEIVVILDRDIYSTDKLPLTKDMAKHFNETLTNKILNKFSNNLFNYASKIIELSSNRLKKITSTISNVDYIKVNSGRNLSDVSWDQTTLPDLPE